MISKNSSETIHIGGQINQLQRFHRRYTNAGLAEHDLNGAMHTILFTLADNPGVSQDYLSTTYNMDKGIIARMCKALESRNLIVRKTNESDRRQYCLFLTEEGEKLIPVIEDSYQSWCDLICRGFSEEEVAQAYSLLTRMLENCRDVLGE